MLGLLITFGLMASGNGTLSNVHHSSMLLVGNMDLASESQWDT